jgi:hypothetical protein
MSTKSIDLCDNLPAGDLTPSRPVNTRWDCQEQLRLIGEHRTQLCQELGHEVNSEAAACDWIAKYAASWRQGRERRIPFVLVSAPSN